MLKYECDVCRAINGPEETYNANHPYQYITEFANMGLTIKPMATDREAGDYCGACVLRGVAELIGKMAPHLLATDSTLTTSQEEWISDFIERGGMLNAGTDEETDTSDNPSSDVPAVPASGEVQGPRTDDPQVLADVIKALCLCTTEKDERAGGGIIIKVNPECRVHSSW